MSSAKKMYCAAWMARLTGLRYQERRKRMLSTCTWYHWLVATSSAAGAWLPLLQDARMSSASSAAGKKEGLGFWV